MPRVLVVDDEVGVRTALARGLMAEGMEVVTAADGPTALQTALKGTFDVILLDVIIPGLSGYRVLERLRAAGVDTPVLLVSAKDGEVDQADGLDLGADGYVVKPFSFLVLLARIRALLRRQDDIRPGQLRLGELTVDPVAEQVRWAGRPVELTSREFALLHALVHRQGTVLSKDELLRVAWGGPQVVTRNAVEVYIGYVRRKLADAGAGLLINTVRGQGYRISVASE
jgi:DNA-binding response OmpR family regulator